mmetsp:Transcript_11567/g.30219  ORF Transcript_11567/g.30219 Transcript_11567/m.30219 type:complete len:211 (-) Transcript_11567:39-671(-)
MVGRIQVCQVHCLRPVLGDSDQGRMQKRHPALHQKHWEQPQSLAPAGAAAAPGECAGRCVDAAPGCCEDAAAFVKSPDQTQGLTPVGVVGLVQEGSAAQGARAHCHCRMQKRRWRVCGCWDGESYEAPLKATPEMHQGQPWWQPLHRMETAAAAAAADLLCGCRCCCCCCRVFLTGLRSPIADVSFAALLVSALAPRWCVPLTPSLLARA